MDVFQVQDWPSLQGDRDWLYWLVNICRCRNDKQRTIFGLPIHSSVAGLPVCSSVGQSVNATDATRGIRQATTARTDRTGCIVMVWCGGWTRRREESVEITRGLEMNQVSLDSRRVECLNTDQEHPMFLSAAKGKQLQEHSEPSRFIKSTARDSSAWVIFTGITEHESSRVCCGSIPERGWHGSMVLPTAML